jgi:NADPH:quinone reductase-like Zn-dependent oxidoreductase
MKAAVLNELGKSPVYKEFPDPVPQNDEQVLIQVKAASITNLDKGRASGKHYASYANLPTVVGVDGVGILEDGTRVYAQGITGMMAEKALISKNRVTVLPDDLDYLTAAALPNAVFGAAMAILFRANMKKGDTVLINGATGFTGQLAVQVAKHYKAAKIIATGRNEAALEKLKQLGSDITISLKQNDEAIVKQLKEIHSNTPVDIVIDYLWGHPAELIITALKGGGLHGFTRKVRIVTVGGMAGEHINLASSTLRSSDIELLGSGFGSLSKEDVSKFGKKILPEMFQLAAEGKLQIEVTASSLENIESFWEQDVESGKRKVITID